MKAFDKKIFVVDDDKFFAQLVQSYLNKNGYKKCPVFYSCSDMMNQFYFNPDLVILDYCFNDQVENGHDILKQIKEFRPDTKVIMLSNQEYLNVVVKSYRFGADDYIEKNTRCLQELLKSVNEIFNVDISVN